MTIARSDADVLADHTTLELECVDRMYLNVYVPLLQTPAGVAYYPRDVVRAPVEDEVGERLEQEVDTSLGPERNAPPRRRVGRCRSWV